MRSSTLSGAPKYNSINKASTRLCVQPNGCNKGGFAGCFIFSTAAPKPRAEGSSPSAPAKKVPIHPKVYRYFFGPGGTIRQARRAEYPLPVKWAADIHSIFATVYPIGCTRSFSREVRRAGQRLRAPPRRRLLHIVRGDFQNHRLLISRRLLFAKGHAPFACSVVNALATALCHYQPFARKKKARAGVGAAVEKIEEKRQPEDFFGHRKRGCEATSSPSAPATEKALKPLGFGACSLRFRGRRTVCFAAF